MNAPSGSGGGSGHCWPQREGWHHDQTAGRDHTKSPRQRGIAPRFLVGYVRSYDRAPRTLTLIELAALANVTPYQIENWLKRLDLKTRYAKTAQGHARGFNRANCLEITVLAELIRAGIKPEAAIARVQPVLQKMKTGAKNVMLIADEKREFQVLDFGRPLDAKAINAGLKAGTVLVAIDVARIVERVAARFAKVRGG